MRVLLVGSNPSLKNPDPKVAFEGTRSGTTLTKWIRSLDLPEEPEFHMINVSCKATRTVSEISFNSGEISVLALFAKSCDAVIGLGRKASGALTKAGVKHHEMPHPSGLNRKLNDPRYVEDQLRQCEEYLRAEMRRTGAGRSSDEEGRDGPAGPKDRRESLRRDEPSVHEEAAADEVQPGQGGEESDGGEAATG